MRTSDQGAARLCSVVICIIPRLTWCELGFLICCSRMLFRDNQWPLDASIVFPGPLRPVLCRCRRFTFLTGLSNIRISEKQWSRNSSLAYPDHPWSSVTFRAFVAEFACTATSYKRWYHRCLPATLLLFLHTYHSDIYALQLNFLQTFPTCHCHLSTQNSDTHVLLSNFLQTFQHVTSM